MVTALDDLESEWGALGNLSDDDRPDFGALRADLAEAREAVETLNARARSDGLAEEEAERINTALIDAAKSLMPVNYTTAGEFGHDLAMGAQTLPSLRPTASLAGMSDDEQWASLHQLRRSLNSARYHVRLATALLRGAF
jgi:hypothetical protein